MTNMTRDWVARDSMNQPVWNIGSLAPNSESNAKKVRKSKSELTGPSTSMKRSMNLMFQRTGLRSASASTLSNGTPTSETS